MGIKTFIVALALLRIVILLQLLKSPEVIMRNYVEEFLHYYYFSFNGSKSPKILI